MLGASDLGHTQPKDQLGKVGMSDPLAGVGPSPQWAERAKAAIDQGRKIGATTQRERDDIEAVAAYDNDWANRPVAANP